MTTNVKTRNTKTGDRKQKTATDKSPGGPFIKKEGRKYYTGTKNIWTTGLTSKQARNIPYFWRFHWGFLKGGQKRNIINAVLSGKSGKSVDKIAGSASSREALKIKKTGKNKELKIKKTSAIDR
jgi:hypothetical protein